MKRLMKITLFVLGPVILVGLGGVVPGFRPLAQSQAVVESANGHLLSLNVACDCRTSSNPQGQDRGDVFIIQGKIFPAGTLPAGTATNDPTEPVNGIAPIGDWICRGQVAGLFPPAVAPSYSSTPFAWNTQYFLLGDGHALTGEGYDIADKGFLALTGGIGRFRGASGDIEAVTLGTNVTGCPNFQAKFKFRSGSGHDWSH